MRVFVAGATGVVGRRLVPLLLGAGHEVTAVARSRAELLRRAGARPIAVDLFDRGAIEQAVSGHDTVINLATRIPPGDRAFFPWAWRENDRIRTHASRNLVHAAIRAGAARFIQESVTLGYVDSGDNWVDEHTTWDPLAHVRSASTAERATQHFTDEGGAGVILRFALFYGPDSSHTIDTIRFARKGIAASFGPREGFISSLYTHRIRRQKHCQLTAHRELAVQTRDRLAAGRAQHTHRLEPRRASGDDTAHAAVTPPSRPRIAPSPRSPLRRPMLRPRLQL